LLYEIVHEEPAALTGLRTGVPIELELLTSKCLAKDRENRYQSAKEIAVDVRTLAEKLKSGRSTILRSPNSQPATTAAPQEADQPRSTGRTWLWPAAAAFAVAAVALAFAAFRPEPRLPPVRLSIPLPPGQTITSSPAISNDGLTIAYAAQLGVDEPLLYLRDLNSFEARVVAGSNGAREPFFSPDGKWVAFFAQGQLQKAEVAGGTPIRLAEAPFPLGGTWSQDNTIIYAPSLGSGLLRIPASGGAPEVLTSTDGAADGYAHVFPQVLPGGRSVLFTIWGQTQGGAVLSLDSGERVMVLTTTVGEAPIFDSINGATGRLLVIDKSASIRAAPFDAAHPAPTSADASVLTDVYYDTDNEFRGWLSVSNSGNAVYAPGNPTKSSLVWVDQEGVTESLGAEQDAYREVMLSPDGTKAAVRHTWGIWIHDLERGTRSPLTAANTVNLSLQWSEDGEQIIFASNRGGDWDIYSQPADGSRPAEALLTRPHDQFPTAVLADGTVLYAEINSQSGFDLWTLSPEGTTSPIRVTPFNEGSASLSPGPRDRPHWLAYGSNESGRSEVYVQSYPSGANRVAVSTGGGLSPSWSRDGKELFYLTGDAVAAVAMRPDGSLGAPRRLFDRANFFFGIFRRYDTSPDGKRFLMIQTDPGSVPRQLDVILNWSAE
jgi:Tol biopolymer transport system component